MDLPSFYKLTGPPLHAVELNPAGLPPGTGVFLYRGPEALKEDIKRERCARQSVVLFLNAPATAIADRTRGICSKAEGAGDMVATKATATVMV